MDTVGYFALSNTYKSHLILITRTAQFQATATDSNQTPRYTSALLLYLAISLSTLKAPLQERWEFAVVQSQAQEAQRAGHQP